VSPGKTLFFMAWFKGCITIEKTHPLEGGYLRLKFRRDRRPGMPLEPAWRFYPKYLVETVWKQIQWLALYVRLRLIYLKHKHDPRRHEYMDLALEPVADDETETRELFQSEAAVAFVGQMHKRDEARRPKAA
ncbi:MAG TPA: hypothetical protein VIK18_04435, partial [Pirellulales bacterium]